jgi:hypothetical protein
MELLFWAESAFAPAAKRQIFLRFASIHYNDRTEKYTNPKVRKKISVVNQAKGVPMADALYTAP